MPLPKVSLDDARKSMQLLAGAAAHFNGEIRRQVEAFNKVSGAIDGMVIRHERMLNVGRKIYDNWAQNKNISIAQVAAYARLSDGVRRLTDQYRDYESIQRLLTIATMSWSDKIKMAGDTLGKLGSGIAGTAAKMGGLTFGVHTLTDKLLVYNRTVFDGMRIGERYGDSFAKFGRALDIVKRNTALSQQQFAELNLAIKQGMLGMPMASDAVAKYAANLTYKLGWSAEKVSKSFQSLLPLQNKLPSLFDRITKAQDAYYKGAVEGVKATKALADNLYAIGASRSDIEEVMSHITNPKFNFDKWMGFEKTIAKSKRDIEDVSLQIANKLQSGLEAVAWAQAGIAKIIGSMPSGIMLAVGAMALFGAQAGNALASLVQMGKALKMLPLQATAFFGGGLTGRVVGAGLQGMVGGTGSTLRRRLGGTAAVAAGVIGGELSSNYLVNDYTATTAANYDPKNEPRGSRLGAAWRGAAAEGGGFAASGAVMGSRGGVYGALAGAGIGLVAGGLVGGVKGYMAGGDANKAMADKRKEYLESQGELTSRMGAIAEAAGVSNVDRSSREAVLDSIAKETNAKTQLLALEALYGQGLIRRSDVVDIIAKKEGDITKAREAADALIVKSLTGLDQLYDIQRQIERSVEGQTQELEAHIDVYNKLAETGKDAQRLLQEGLIGADWAKSMMETGLASQEQSVKAIGKQLGLAYAKSFSDNQEVRDEFFKGPDQVAAGKIANAQNNINKQSKKIDSLRDSKQQKMDKETDPGKKAALEKRLDSELQAEKLILDNYTDKLALGEKSVKFENLSLDNVKKTIDKTNEEVAAQRKMRDELAAAGKDVGAIEDGIDHLVSRQQILNEYTAKWQAALAGPILQAYENIAAKSRLDIGLQDQLVGLGEARLSLAEKMGMPQSYRALKDQVGLVYNRYEMESNLYKQQDQETRRQSQALLKQHGIVVDIDAVINNTKSIEQVRNQAIAEAENDEKKRSQVSALVNVALKNQVGTMTTMVNLEGKLAELTKTWREGWMDAMEESVANAGDFAAVIGLGDKNVPEKIAAGAPDTFRYGGTNRKALDAYTAQQLRYGQAARFTDQFGNINGNIQNPNSLMTHSNAMAWNPQSSADLHAANQQAVQQGIIPVSATGPASQAGLDALTEAVSQGVSNAITYKPAGAATITPWQYGAADMRGLGTGQPGNPSSGKLAPDVGYPFQGSNAASDLKDAAANLNSAAGALNLLGSQIRVTTGAPAKRASGGFAGSPRGGVQRFSQGGKPDATHYAGTAAGFGAGALFAGNPVGLGAAAIGAATTYGSDWYTEHKSAEWLEYSNQARLGKINKKLGTSYKSLEELNEELNKREMAKKNARQKALSPEQQQAHLRSFQLQNDKLAVTAKSENEGVSPEYLEKARKLILSGPKGEEAWRLGGERKLTSTPWTGSETWRREERQVPKLVADQQMIIEEKTKLLQSVSVEKKRLEIQHEIATAEAQRDLALIPIAKKLAAEERARSSSGMANDAEATLKAEMASDKARALSRGWGPVQMGSQGYVPISMRSTESSPVVSVADRGSKLVGAGQAYAANKAIQQQAADSGKRTQSSASYDPYYAFGRPKPTKMADGGMIEPGSFIVKASQAGNAAGIPGVDYVSGGTPGMDSVMFGVAANGGQVLAMPGEAIVPPEYAHIGQAINEGFMSMADGGSVSDAAAARDIARTPMSFSGGGGGGGSSGGGVTLELTPEVAELLRFQGKNDYRNGSTI